MDNGIVDDKMILNLVRGLIEDTLKDNSNDFVRRKKMYVTECAHETEDGKKVITVQEAFGDAFEIPYVPSLLFVQPGDSVWVEWVYGFGNACAVNSGAWQASDLPTCVIPTEDGLIIQVDYKPVMVISTSGVSMDVDTLEVSGHIAADVVNTTEPRGITVNGKIQDAIDGLGKYLKGNVLVIVPNGTYVEDVRIEGFYGTGGIYMTFLPGAVVKGDWVVRGCGRVLMQGMSDGNGGGSTFVGVIDDAVLDVNETVYFEISGVQIHGVERAAGDDGQDYGIRVADGSYALIKNCLIDRTQVALYVKQAHMDIVNCTGGLFSLDETTVANMTDGAMISYEGGYANARGTIPAGPDSTLSGYTDNGFLFTCAGTVTPTESTGSTPPPSVDEETTTWTATSGYFCESEFGGPNAWQGYASGWQGNGAYNLRMGMDYKKMTAGIWTFADASTIATTLNNKTITKATVSITRTGAGGAGSGAVVKPYYHAMANSDIATYSTRCDPWGYNVSSGDRYTDCGCTAQYIDYGMTATFELPSGLYPLLKNGSIKGFAVGMNHPTQFFQFGPTACVLTVTYE